MCVVFVCTTEKGRKVILGTSPLSKLPLALCSSLQPDLFILCLKRSHFLLRPLPLAVQRCLSVCVHVCVVHVLSVQEHLSQWEKSIFPPKERARQQCQRYWLELATWEARKRWRGRTFGCKRQGKSLMWSSLVSFSRPLALRHTHTRATRWLTSCCDADIWKGKVRRGDGRRERMRWREDERQGNNLLWLSWGDCVRLTQPLCWNKKHRPAQFQMFKWFQDQEIKTCGLFAFPPWGLRCFEDCPSLIIHRVWLYWCEIFNFVRRKMQL